MTVTIAESMLQHPAAEDGADDIQGVAGQMTAIITSIIVEFEGNVVKAVVAGIGSRKGVVDLLKCELLPLLRPCNPQSVIMEHHHGGKPASRRPSRY